MRSKVIAAEMATAAGIPTVIATACARTALAAVCRRARADAASPRGEPLLELQAVAKYAKPVRGHVEVDAGAARALREGGTSLLPVGVTEVDGDFDAGDAIEIRSGRETIGKGICNYSAV